MVLGALWGFLTYLWGSLRGVLWKSILELLFDKARKVFKRPKESKGRRGSKRPKKKESKGRRGSKALVRRGIA